MAAEQNFAVDPQTDIESSSTWILTSARLMAKCAAMMSQGGIIDGVRILKQSTVEEALSSPIIHHDVFLNFKTAFTKGGFSVIGRFDKLEEITKNEYYGWGGINGSMMMFQYKGGEPGGRAFGYNCSACYKVFGFDIRGLEIMRQVGVNLIHRDGPKNFKVQLQPSVIEKTALLGREL